MNLGKHPELLDRLAAGYALGTLRGGARRRLEFYSRQSATVRTATLLWQERLAAFAELPAPIEPNPRVWQRIEAIISQERDLAVQGKQISILTEQKSRLDKLTESLSRTLERWRDCRHVCNRMDRTVANPS
jgi:anti-sigma-K factor RskA